MAFRLFFSLRLCLALPESSPDVQQHTHRRKASLCVTARAPVTSSGATAARDARACGAATCGADQRRLHGRCRNAGARTLAGIRQIGDVVVVGGVILVLLLLDVVNLSLRSRRARASEKRRRHARQRPCQCRRMLQP
jgi:hypothetical protein